MVKRIVRQIKIMIISRKIYMFKFDRDISKTAREKKDISKF